MQPKDLLHCIAGIDGAKILGSSVVVRELGLAFSTSKRA
jgi:hypothetical protein